MKRKFKIGDMVKCIDEEQRPYGLIGKVIGYSKSFYSLIQFDKLSTRHGGLSFAVDDKGNTVVGKSGECFFCADYELELIADKTKQEPLVKVEQKIVITTDGKTTTAKLYDGKKIIETAEAKCSPSDKFDFAIGAKLAFERLTDSKTEEETEFALEKQKLLVELQNFADLNNDEIDWKTTNQEKHYLVFSHYSEEFIPSSARSFRDIGQIYFTSSDIARQAIAKFGDRIKKYLFDVRC